MGKANRKIEQAIPMGEWEIEIQWGLQQWINYLNEVSLLESGAIKYKDLGLYEKRQSQRPAIICASSFEQIAIGESVFNDTSSIPPGSIAHIKIRGVMRMENGLSSRSMKQIAADLRAADNNPNIDGIFIELNSGGGEAMAGSVIQNAMLDISKAHVVFFQMMASAALKGMLPANILIADGQEAKVGSIGTMVTIDKRMVQRFNEFFRDIYADASTLKNIESRALLQGNESPLKNMLNKTNQFFIDQVTTFRNLAGDQDIINEFLAGKIHTSDVAKSVGLIDGTSTFSKALNALTQEIERSKSNPVFAFDTGFSNKLNNQEMNLTKFLQSIIPILNSKFSLGLSAEKADGQEVIQALESMKSIDEITAAIKAEVQESIKANNEKLTSLENNLQETNDKLSAQASELKKLQEEKTAMEEKNKELESQVANFKGKVDDNHQKKNSKVLDPAQFETVMGLHMALEPQGESKY